MLHEFLNANREELIVRCRAKVSRRSSPRVTSPGLEHGVPVFLEQLVDALRHEQEIPPPSLAGVVLSSAGPASSDSRAALHGKELFHEGYSVDQVVHDYGDICQAITELAQERNAPVTVEEFQTFNRLLDNAIADAVFSYGNHRERSVRDLDAQDLHGRLGALAAEQRELLDTALKALEALKVGNLGLGGATGSLLEGSLMKLRDLIDRAHPEIRLSSGMTTPPRA